MWSKKWSVLTSLALVLAAATVHADIVIDKDGTVYSGDILRTDGRSLVLSSQGQKLYSLKDIRGFARTDQEVFVTLAGGERFIARMVGADSQSVILSGPEGLQSYAGTKIDSLTPYQSRLFADTEAGLWNGIQLLGYNPLRDRVVQISTASNLPALGYAAGAYLETRYFLSPSLGLRLGAGVTYLPTQSTPLMNSGGTKYGDLYADSVKIELRTGIFLALGSRLDVGIGLAPALNVTSVYQVTATNTAGTYITHTTFGLRPSLELRYRLWQRLTVGISAGYELMSTPDGVFVGITTGLRY